MTVLFLFTILLIIAFQLNARKQEKMLNQEWALIRESHSLDFQPATMFKHPSLSGVVDGYPVEVTVQARSHGRNKVPYTVVKTYTGRLMPEGMQVTQENLSTSLSKLVGGQDVVIGDDILDMKLRFRGSQPDQIRALFADEAVRDEAFLLLAQSSFSRVHGQQVILEAPGRSGAPVEEMIAGVVKLARALDDARLRPWQDLAARHGLTLHDEGEVLRLSGALHGQPIALHINLQHSTAHISAPITGLPEGLLVTADRTGDTLRLGDPILDGMVSVAGEDAEAIRALLRDDDLRGALLAVVHGAGGVVRADGVSLEAVGAIGEDVEARMVEVSALAARLCARLQDRPAHTQRARQEQTQGS